MQPLRHFTLRCKTCGNVVEVPHRKEAAYLPVRTRHCSICHRHCLHDIQPTYLSLEELVLEAHLITQRPLSEQYTVIIKLGELQEVISDMMLAIHEKKR